MLYDKVRSEHTLLSTLNNVGMAWISCLNGTGCLLGAIVKPDDFTERSITFN